MIAFFYTNNFYLEYWKYIFYLQKNINYQKQMETNKFNLSATKGTVLKINKSQTQHVYSYGGGGYIIDGSGYVAPSKIASETKYETEIFLIKEDNSEDCIVIHEDISIRETHKIVYITARNNSNDKYNCALFNETLNKSQFLFDESKLENHVKIYRKITFWKGFFITIFSGIILSAIFNMTSPVNIIQSAPMFYLVVIIGIILYNKQYISKQNNKNITEFASDVKNYLTQIKKNS